MSVTYQQNEIAAVAKMVIEDAPSKTICFNGSMGAGKTTLIKAIVTELAGIGNVSSPTFGIVNEYHKVKGEILGYHFDFYRLKDETEVLDLGFEDYLSQDVWIFIEWPEKIKSFLPDKVFNVYIEIENLNTRKISF